MSEKTITPLPWRLHTRPTYGDGAVLSIVNDEFCQYVSIATIYAIPQKRAQYEAIAEYMLTACNAYPALTARVKELEESRDYYMQSAEKASKGRALAELRVKELEEAHINDLERVVRSLEEVEDGEEIDEIMDNVQSRINELRAALNKEPTT